MEKQVKTIVEEGNTGGNGGASFDDRKQMGTPSSIKQYFKEIKVTYGSFFLRQLIITKINNDVINHGMFYAADGNTESITFNPQNEDDLIDSVEVYTVSDQNNNYVTGIGIKRRKDTNPIELGNCNGSPNGVYEVPDGYVLNAFMGREGQAIDALGVVFQEV